MFGDHDRREDSAVWAPRNRQTHFSRRLWSKVERDVRSRGSGGQVIAVMPPAKPWHGYNAATGIPGPHCIQIAILASQSTGISQPKLMQHIEP